MPDVQEEFTLRFAWPEGLAVRVEHERRVDAERDGRFRRWRSTSRFVLVRKGDTIRVREHARNVQEQAPPEPGTLDHEPILRAIEESAPSCVLDSGGLVAGLVEGEGERIRRAVALPPALVGAQPALSGLLARLTTDAALRNAAGFYWNPLVAGFVGATLCPGVRAYGEYLAPLPILPVTIPHDIEMLGDVERDGSVRVRARCTPRPEPLRRAIEAVVAPGFGGLRLVSYASTTDTELHCDAATMIPRSASEAVRSRTESRLGDVRREQWSEDHRSWTCTVEEDD